MTAQEYTEMKERRAMLNARQMAARDQARDLRAQADTLDQQRARDKATCAELDAQLQAYERALPRGTPARVPHPEKPGVVIEYVEKPAPPAETLTFGRALKKVFTGR